jgi:hypothetical protein
MADWNRQWWVAIAGGLWLLLATAEPARAQSKPEKQPTPAEAAPEAAPAGTRASRADDARLLAFQKLEPHVKRPGDIPPAARLEFRVHARRMARLARIRALAEYANDRATVQRADRISERERMRHQHALRRVWPALSDPTAPVRDSEETEPRAPEDEEEAEPEP